MCKRDIVVVSFVAALVFGANWYVGRGPGQVVAQNIQDQKPPLEISRRKLLWQMEQTFGMTFEGTYSSDWVTLSGESRNGLIRLMLEGPIAQDDISVTALL